jgi:dienelactone hydrolase
MEEMMLKQTLFALALAASGLAHAGTDVDYADGKTPLQGYLAGADLKGKVPGVLIVHQWMGLTDYEKGRADQLAKELGVVAFAADVYGKGVRAKDMKEAGELAGKYKGDRALYQSRVSAALAELKAQPNVDPAKVAVIGYCFGGMGALDQARLNAQVAGVVSFHGSLEPLSPASAAVIKPKVLVLHGAADPWENAAKVEALKAELTAAKADFKVKLYKGAVHAFTQPGAGDDPSKGMAYNAAADKQSWADMKAFFAKLF